MAGGGQGGQGGGFGSGQGGFDGTMGGTGSGPGGLGTAGMGGFGGTGGFGSGQGGFSNGMNFAPVGTGRYIPGGGALVKGPAQVLTDIQPAVMPPISPAASAPNQALLLPQFQQRAQQFFQSPAGQRFLNSQFGQQLQGGMKGFSQGFGFPLRNAGSFSPDAAAPATFAEGGSVDYADLGARLPSTWGTSAQDTYNRVMALGSSPEYAAYYNALPSHLKAYATPPASGANDPNWAYRASQEQNQWEVSQGTNPFTTSRDQSTTPIGVSKGLSQYGLLGSLFGSKGIPAGISKSLTKPYYISKPKEGVDNDGGTPIDKPGSDTTPPSTTPSPLGVSENYRTYVPPKSNVYQPSTYAYKPTPASRIGYNPTPTDPERLIFAPLSRQVPGGARAPAQSNQSNQGIANLLK